MRFSWLMVVGALLLGGIAYAQTPQDIAVEILFRSITPVDGVVPQDQKPPLQPQLPPDQRRVAKWDHAALKLYISLDPSDPADPAPLNAMLQRYFDGIAAETKMTISYATESDKADIWINYKRAAGLAAYIKRYRGVDGVMCFGSLFHRDEMPGDKVSPNWGVMAVPSDLGDVAANTCLAEMMTRLLGYSRRPAREEFGFDQASLAAIKPVSDFDRMVLGLLYAPNVKAGMNKDELRKIIDHH